MVFSGQAKKGNTALSSLGYSGSKLITLCRPPPCLGTHVLESLDARLQLFCFVR